MLLQKSTRGYEDAVRIVTCLADEHSAHGHSCLVGEEGLGSDKYLLNVVGVLQEVGDTVSRWNLAHVLELISLHQVLKPGRQAEPDRDRVAIQIVKAANRRLGMHHHSLRIVLHGRTHRYER